MITYSHVEGNYYGKTETGPFRKLPVTFTLRPYTDWVGSPTTGTLTDTWDYGVHNFETYHRTFTGRGIAPLCTSGRRGHYL